MFASTFAPSPSTIASPRWHDSADEPILRINVNGEPTHHRRLLVLRGKAAWCRASAAALLQDLEPQTPLWIGESSPDGVRGEPPRKVHRVLGGECDLLVFDALDGFDPDAFGAASGTLRGGGWIVLLAPPASEWGTPFLQRLERLMRADESVTWIEERGTLPALSPTAQPTVADTTNYTPEQLQAADAVAHVVHGHRRRPLVLTADRGRGKSSALGLAAARLLEEGVERVVVTAPRMDAVEPLFEHAARRLEGCETARGSVRWRDRRIDFLPPDELAARPVDTRLLLVDEAAAIPAPLLTTLLRHHARVVFSTTVHGYEGSGRGFAIRFRHTLDQLTPGWRSLRLEQPVRWSADDPLERLTFRALCLDASPADEATAAEATAENLLIERLDREALAHDEATLNPLFGLLVSAHYRTTPTDLKQMLDDPAVSLWIARHNGAVIATALVTDEGGFDEATARAVFEGRRRPRGHLLAQSLALHGGLEQAPTLRFARIQRIAVHPAAQGRGIGGRLVQALSADAAQRRLDALGVSFGAEPGLLRFWTARGLHPVHIGFTRDHAGGAHSAMLLHPLSTDGETLAETARRRFDETLPLLLGGPLRDLDPNLAAQLLAHCEPPADLTASQRREVQAVAFADRGIDASLAALRSALLHALIRRDIEPDNAALAVARLFQHHSWETCAKAFGLSGRKEVVAALRHVLSKIVANN